MTGLHDIEALVAARQKILAIKEFRARTGVGLKDAKDAVEHFEAHGRWPDEYGHGQQAPGAAPFDPVPQPPRPDHALRAVEALVAQGEIIAAIKELRTVTQWGLRELKEAVDEYRERGRWPGPLVALVEQASVRPTPTPTPAPAPTHEPSPAAHEASSPRSASASLRKALVEHLGHEPDIQLVLRADRSSREGHLVMLRDRACFVHTDRRLGVEPTIPYDAVRHVEVAPGSPAVLYVSFGHVHERFSLAASEAEAALALFRVFAP